MSGRGKGGKGLGEHTLIEVDNKCCQFSHVFEPDSSQEAVYEETSGVVRSVLDGYNVCIFAYGQTGSGKTHTMNGSKDDPGVNYRALQDLFRTAEERGEFFGLTVSMLEIYNETLRDLLYEKEKNGGKNQPPLEIHVDPTAKKTDLSASDKAETISSLQFAERVARIQLGSAQSHVDNSGELKRVMELLEAEDAEIAALELLAEDAEIAELRAEEAGIAELIAEEAEIAELRAEGAYV